jgi:hypothetical protein
MWHKFWDFLFTPNYESKQQIVGLRFLFVLAIFVLLTPLLYHRLIPVKETSFDKVELDSLKILYAQQLIKDAKPSHAGFVSSNEYKPNSNSKSTYTTKNSTIVKFNLNQASAEQLESVRGIGVVLAERIVKYRTQLGGFYSQNQLYEVYGLDSVVVKESFKYLEGNLTPSTFLKINEEEFKVLLKHPYLEYEDVKVIFKNRPVASKEMLVRILPTKGEKFSHYVTY